MTDGRPTDSTFDAWGWDEHEQAQRRRYAQMPLADKIAWLEEAQRMVLYLEQQRLERRKRKTGDSSEG